YVDDVRIPNSLHAMVVRSPYAHAKIKNIEISEASRARGVELVLTSRQLPQNLSLNTLPTTDGVKIPRPLLAVDEVCFSGEAVAFVVADTRAHAEDAVELLKVEYEPLEAVTDIEQALENTSPKAHLGLKTNAA